MDAQSEKNLLQEVVEYTGLLVLVLSGPILVAAGLKLDLLAEGLFVWAAGLVALAAVRWFVREVPSRVTLDMGQVQLVGGGIWMVVMAAMLGAVLFLHGQYLAAVSLPVATISFVGVVALPEFLKLRLDDGDHDFFV